MSYGVAAALQAAVFQKLASDSALTALVGSAVYDAVPPGGLPETYVSLGPEEARGRTDATGAGAVHIFTVSVVSSAAGFAGAKAAAGAISDALVGAALPLTRGTLVGLSFEKARARRVEDGDVRRIDLTFRARVDDE